MTLSPSVSGEISPVTIEIVAVAEDADEVGQATAADLPELLGQAGWTCHGLPGVGIYFRTVS
jgi:hypothetical protein